VTQATIPSAPNQEANVGLCFEQQLWRRADALICRRCLNISVRPLAHKPESHRHAAAVTVGRRVVAAGAELAAVAAAVHSPAVLPRVGQSWDVRRAALPPGGPQAAQTGEIRLDVMAAVQARAALAVPGSYQDGWQGRAVAPQGTFPVTIRGRNLAERQTRVVAAGCTPGRRGSDDQSRCASVRGLGANGGKGHKIPTRARYQRQQPLVGRHTRHKGSRRYRYIGHLDTTLPAPAAGNSLAFDTRGSDTTEPDKMAPDRPRGDTPIALSGTAGHSRPAAPHMLTWE